MPIISNGEKVKINLFAGIRNNGISATRTTWRFYDILEIDTLVKGGVTVSRPLVFRYNSAVTFAWMEDFDSEIGLSVRKTQYSDTTFKIAAPEDCFENRSIELGLHAPHTQAEIETAGDGIKIPASNSNVYLELNYKCNHAFSVGLIGDDGRLRPIQVINPQDKWNKIYIQLAAAVNSPQTSSR